MKSIHTRNRDKASPHKNFRGHRQWPHRKPVQRAAKICARRAQHVFDNFLQDLARSKEFLHWKHLDRKKSQVDRKKPHPPGGFPIYYVPSSRTVCKRTPLEEFVPGATWLQVLEIFLQGVFALDVLENFFSIYRRALQNFESFLQDLARSMTSTSRCDPASVTVSCDKLRTKEPPVPAKSKMPFRSEVLVHIRQKEGIGVETPLSGLIGSSPPT